MEVKNQKQHLNNWKFIGLNKKRFQNSNAKIRRYGKTMKIDIFNIY